MPIKAFRVMSPVQAAHFREQTAGLQHRLDPIEVLSPGPYLGRYVVGSNVLFDENHADKRAALLMLTEIALDTSALQPPAEEPEE